MTEQVSYLVDGARVYVDYKIDVLAQERNKYFIRMVRGNVISAYVCTVTRSHVDSLTDKELAEYLVKHTRRSKLFDAVECPPKNGGSR